MEIHVPEGPTRSFKEFAIHILIVTIGILIALGLEGIRETMHEHNALEATRQTFRSELGGNRDNLLNETVEVQKKNAGLNSILQDYDQLVRTPAELRKRVDEIEPSLYFFSATAWGTAMSSGVLTYMKTDEANRYSEVYTEIEIYRQLSHQAVIDWIATQSFFDSRKTYTPQDAIDGEQKLRAYQFNLRMMKYQDQAFMNDLNKALAPQ